MRFILLMLLCVVLYEPLHAKPPLDNNNTTPKMEYFFFQTTGDPEYLLSPEILNAVKLSADLTGYSSKEIEVTITVTDKKSKKTRSKPARKATVRKPKIKKFE